VSEHPPSWIEVTLGSLLRFNYGKSLPERARSGVGFPVYGSNGVVGYHDNALIDGETLIIGRKGSVGEVHLSPGSCFPIDTTYYVDQFHGMPTRYWFYQLKNLRLSELNKATAIPGLNREDAYRTKVYLSPLNEQKRIADKLDALLARVDACRDRLDRVPRILEHFRQTVIDLAISGELTKSWRKTEQIRINNAVGAIQIEPTGDFFDVVNSTEYFIPDSWVWLTPGLIKSFEKYSLSIGPFGSNLTVRDYRNVGIPLVFVRDIRAKKFGGETTKFISEEKAQELWAHRVEPGDLLITKMGDPPGDVAIFPPEHSIAIITADCIRIKVNPEIVSVKLLSIFIESSLIKSLIKIITAGVAQQKISLQRFRSMPLPIPPLNEQQEIVRRVESLFAYADRIETRYQNALMKVERLTPVLLNKAFHGELVPQDPNDEPASVLLERIQAEKIRMESERKTKRTIRRSTKETPKVPMKKLSDYLEALRSAFGALGDKADARQLFDQAEFKSEEVVQFYEALRAAPEVRVAFEKSRQERPPQKPNSFPEGTDNQPSKNGRFRLIELWLEDFKNLTNYTVRFDPSHSIDIVLGWNGTGKSNLFEALVIIFRDLYKWWEKNQWAENPMKGYRLRYVMDRKIVEVSWKPGEMKRPKLKMGTLQEGKEEPDKFESLARDKLLLPRFIFGYYSGPTNRLAEHFLPMKQDHYNRLRDETSDDPETLANLLEKRRFFCAENHHAKYVLLAFFHKEDSAISQFLEDRLRIVSFESALFVIRRPRWAKKGQTAENFWGARGVMRRVMERLRRFAIAPMVIEQTVSEGYTSRREDHYYFFLPDLQSLHAFAAEYQDARTFFVALESTEFSELIYDVKIQVRVQATKKEQVAITFHELSEGEQQLLMVLGLMRFTKSHQSLVLLDEPDTHLNPHWSVDYLKLLTRVMSESSDESEEQQTSQILMSTHDPLVIASLFKEQIHLLKRDWQTGACKWEQPTVNPRGLGFTGILTSEMFGMRSDLDEETLADLDTQVRLVAKEGSLTSSEVRELEEINKRLEDAGFQKAFSDPYYAAFIRAWGRRHSDLMAGTRFLSQEQQEEIDRISREILEEAIAELQAEAVD
jgi:restriction endonuclease S subunit/energy-coupling factor transporter ATP-binding protein EcfA2